MNEQNSKPLTKDDFWDLIAESRKECGQEDDRVLLWSAAGMMGRASDDGFTDFRSWLISQGKDAYFTALKNPDSLVDLDAGDGNWFETFLYVGHYALEEMTGGNAYARYIKWVDFMRRFWRKDCVTGVSLSTFSATYQKCCTSKRYLYTQAGAEKIYRATRVCVATFPKNDSTKLLTAQSVNSLNTIYDALHIMRTEKLRLASLLPEFESVIFMQGAGKTAGP